jgi:rubrerythrin
LLAKARPTVNTLSSQRKPKRLVINKLRDFFVGEIRSDTENLAAAIGGEQYEFSSMYPDFIEQAKAENNKEAVGSFDMANKVEQVHHKLFQAALKNLENGREFKDAPYYVCQVCGNTVEGEAPDRCPICGAPRDKFKKIE